MDSTTITSLATLGGAFGGAIASQTIAYIFKLRRKRIDYLFNQIDNAYTVAQEAFSDLASNGVKNKSVDLNLIVLGLTQAVTEIIKKPEMIKLHKRQLQSGSLTIKKWYFISCKKRFRIELALNSLLKVDGSKISVKNIDTKQAILFVKTTLKKLDTLYLAFK